MVRICAVAVVRLRKDKYLRTRQRVVTRELQRNWIESAEAFCLSRVPCGLGGLLRQAAVSLDGEPTHKWKAGKKRLSKLPPVDFYPHFLSEKEVEQFLYLGLLHSIPSHGAMGEGKGALVQFSKHYSDLIGLSRLVETRCAEATGVPVHEHEAPVMMQHTLESASGPFVSSLESGITHEKRFRCATVVLFLNDVPEGKGGETRFPLAEISEGHPLIDIGKRAVHQGFSTIDPGAKDAPKEWGTLVDVANGHDLGVHIRPQRGAACSVASEGSNPANAADDFASDLRRPCELADALPCHACSLVRVRGHRRVLDHGRGRRYRRPRLPR